MRTPTADPRRAPGRTVPGGFLLEDAIAGELVTSVQTVNTHGGRILAELGLRARARAIVLACETGLVRPGI